MHLYRVNGRRGIFVPAKVYDDPSNVAQKRDRNCGIDEGEQRLDYSQGDAVIATLRSVTDDVACEEKKH